MLRRLYPISVFFLFLYSGFSLGMINKLKELLVGKYHVKIGIIALHSKRKLSIPNTITSCGDSDTFQDVN